MGATPGSSRPLTTPILETSNTLGSCRSGIPRSIFTHGVELFKFAMDENQIEGSIIKLLWPYKCSDTKVSSILRGFCSLGCYPSLESIGKFSVKNHEQFGSA